jgi:hypothetical protein
MKQSQFYYLLRRGLFSAGSAIIKNGLVMFNKFTTAGLNFPAQGSAEFDGASDYIQTNEEFAFVNSEYTISFWAYLNSSNTSLYPTTFQNGAYNSGGIQPFYFEANDYIRMAHNIDGGNAVYGGTIGMAHDEWFFITFTFDGTSVRSYKNGSLQNTVAVAAPSTNFFDAKIGGGVADTYWDGNLANVAIWNRALSSDEINSVMWKSYEALSGAESNGLQAWYSLDDITSPAASLANMEQLAADKDLSIENKAAITAAINALS